MRVLHPGKPGYKIKYQIVYTPNQGKITSRAQAPRGRAAGLVKFLQPGP
jgi:hypothetical protein